MTLTTAQLNEWAKQIINSINGDGESKVFECEFEGFTAEVDYSCEIGEDVGDYWTAPAWWIESEELEVVAVYDEDGEDCPELMANLNQLLN